MNDNSQQKILRHLQDEDVQGRIREKIQRSRMEATVTIGRAADLFGFSESKIRDLEAAGLLRPMRKDSKGQRQYSLQELDKLAIIRELMDARYTPGEIPRDVDALWYSVAHTIKDQGQLEQHWQAADSNSLATLPIDQRLDHEKSFTFWRSYAIHALRMSLMLISDSLPHSTIGLIVPLYVRSSALVKSIDDLPVLGESLVGWLNRSSTAQTIFTARPSFRYPTDYSLCPLAPMRDERPQQEPEDAIMIVLERPDKRAKALSLSEPFVKLIRRLLTPLREEARIIQECFGLGMRDEHSSAIDLNAMGGYQDVILEGLANMVIRLGGRTANNEQNRWRFCTILVRDTARGLLPLLQRSLIVRAQSSESPYIVGESSVSPLKSKTSIGIRAFQSGRIIYRPELSTKDRTPAFLDVEGRNIRSNIAVPIGSEQGQPVAVLYVASEEIAAFPREDQQLLRIMGRMIEITLNTYTTRLQVTRDLRSLMRTPEVVDTLFGEFLSENDFMRDVESLLTNMDAWLGEGREEQDEEKIAAAEEIEQLEARGDVISFIGVDIDDQESLASRYGDQILRQMSKTIGLRIHDLVSTLVTRDTSCQLYYMYADRFYLILRGISLKKARTTAGRLREILAGNISLKQSDVSDNVLIIPNITVHLAVTSFTRPILSKLLLEYPTVADISARFSQELDMVLKMGLDEGGNIVISWDYKTKRFIPWSLSIE